MVQPVVLAERDIESVHTQVIIQTFSDRVLVIMTQLQKVGTLVCDLRFYCWSCSMTQFRSTPPYHLQLPSLKPLQSTLHPTLLVALYHQSTLQSI